MQNADKYTSHDRAPKEQHRDAAARSTTHDSSSRRVEPERSGCTRTGTASWRIGPRQARSCFVVAPSRRGRLHPMRADTIIPACPGMMPAIRPWVRRPRTATPRIHVDFDRRRILQEGTLGSRDIEFGARAISNLVQDVHFLADGMPGISARRGVCVAGCRPDREDCGSWRPRRMGRLWTRTLGPPQLVPPKFTGRCEASSLAAAGSPGASRE